MAKEDLVLLKVNKPMPESAQSKSARKKSPLKKTKKEVEKAMKEG